jgi:hypothetical protein
MSQTTCTLANSRLRFARFGQRSATFKKDFTTIAKDLLSDNHAKINEATAGVMGVLDGWVKDHIVQESVIMESGRKLAAADRDPPSIIDVPDARNLFDAVLLRFNLAES